MPPKIAATMFFSQRIKASLINRARRIAGYRFWLYVRSQTNSMTCYLSFHQLKRSWPDFGTAASFSFDEVTLDPKYGRAIGATLVRCG